MKLSTDIIINMLPVNPSVREKLLQAVHSSDSDVKFRWEEIVWDAYYTLFEIQYQYNYNLMMEQIGTDKAPFNASFARLVEEKTAKDMNELTYAKVVNNELEVIRKRLQSLSS